MQLHAVFKRHVVYRKNCSRDVYELFNHGEHLSWVSIWEDGVVDEPNVTLAARRLGDARCQGLRDAIKQAVRDAPKHTDHTTSPG